MTADGGDRDRAEIPGVKAAGVERRNHPYSAGRYAVRTEEPVLERAILCIERQSRAVR